LKRRPVGRLTGLFLWEIAMGEVVLSQVGAAIGAQVLPNGLASRLRFVMVQLRALTASGRTENRLRSANNGSPIGSAETTAQVVLLDEALLEVTLSVDELGKPLLWKPGDGDARGVIWHDLGNVPWRVRGLEAMRDGDQVEIVWRANGPGYAPDGTLIDLNKEVRFEVRASLNDTTVLSETISKAFKSISFGVADQFCVAQVGRDGRRGEWLSIPLPSP